MLPWLEADVTNPNSTSATYFLSPIAYALSQWNIHIYVYINIYINIYRVRGKARGRREREGGGREREGRGKGEREENVKERKERQSERDGWKERGGVEEKKRMRRMGCRAWGRGRERGESRERRSLRAKWSRLCVHDYIYVYV